MSVEVYLSPSSQTGNRYTAQNTTEAAICRKIAESLSNELARNGITHKLATENLNVSERVRDSNISGAKYHICIHTNAGGGDGTVVFGWHTTLDNPVLKNVYAEVAAISPGTDDGIRANDGLAEVNGTRAICCYVEVEFHDNADLSTWIVNNVDKIAEAICRGYCKGTGRTYQWKDALTKLYRVQVGAFTVKASAENLLAELKSKGYDAILKVE